MALVFELGVLDMRAAHATEPKFASASIGAFDVFDNKTQSEIRLEYRSDKKIAIFKPLTGFMVTGDESLYGYIGIMVDLYFGRRLVITPSFAPGAWSRGDGKDLGHWIEFRSQMEFSYRMDNFSRLSLSISHMSNAGLDSTNPGQESVMFSYSVPLKNLKFK